MDKSNSHFDEASFEPTRVGVILGELGKLNVPALKYLILHLNTLQRTFEFEFLDIDPLDPLIAQLRPGEVVDRENCRGMLQNFHHRLVERITREQQDYNLVDQSIPDGFVLVTMARFSDEHYGLKSENVQVQAFGCASSRVRAKTGSRSVERSIHGLSVVQSCLVWASRARYVWNLWRGHSAGAWRPEHPQGIPSERIQKIGIPG